MKKHPKLSTFVSGLVSVVFALLGFSSCNNNEDEPVMYGTPYAGFEISGLVTNTDNAPLDHARVIRRTTRASGPDDNDGYGYSTNGSIDTVYTNAKGEYIIQKNDGRKFDRVLIVVQDEGYKEQTKEITLTYSSGSGFWDLGTAKAVENFKLEKDSPQE